MIAKVGSNLLVGATMEKATWLQAGAWSQQHGQTNMKKLTPQSKNFSDWYNEVVLMSGLADYSDVKGCMIIKPYGYALWENIQKVMDKMIKNLGVENVYLPLFIPESYLKKEAEHIKGFAPEVAWVTEAGGKKLEERLAIRPTSETIMYRAFAKWISSYRDLPLKINQWANVVRWEMRTRLFLRTTEFLWQEGHTLHTTEAEANQMVDEALKMYKKFINDYLAIYVLDGLKSDSQKFAGAQYTKAVESIMRDGKALQMGTSHALGQKFAQNFEVKYLDQDGREKYPWPTSWGVSTRLIGGLIMAHGDDKGLILPPKIAPIQVIIIPIYKNNSEKEKVSAYINKTLKDINSEDIRYKIDWDETKSPGWKFNEWELKGVPLRMEIGPKEVGDGNVVLVRRESGEKIKIKKLVLTKVGIRNKTKTLLEEIQNNLLERHTKFVKENTKKNLDYQAFVKDMNKENFLSLVHWCGCEKCEEKIKNDTKATIRVIASEKKSGKCLVCAKETKKMVYLAKAY